MATCDPLHVAVIGAGASGLAAIKCCLDEGLSPVCFERTEHIGGLWHYHDTPVKGQTCVMKSTVVNSSKELMCYSDFPMPSHFANCIHNSQLLKYFHLYDDHFDLKRHIRYQTEVVSIEKSEDYNSTGRWKVCHRHVISGKTSTQTFHAVLVCSGLQTDTWVPEFDGLSDFEGKVLHTNQYRKPNGYEDKRVLVVGIGNSAGDCAVELSRVAKQVYLSTRRGAWVVPRVSDNGYPMDLIRLNRFRMFLDKNFKTLSEKWNERKLNARFDHALYRLKPAHSLFSYQAMLNDDLPSRILNGSIKVKDNVRRFTKNGVEFSDGTKEEDIDVVILATGFTTDFPFLDRHVRIQDIKTKAI
ncbi:dimethylaniline monooxygenase [N-oxide-forming] [Elysia marginata]|uniref:Flavin-containing monooxygenase n=1 Tax=Elysia marginata TaxID=1093978 RepID=A0AAV4HM76_9GAST|nr:dimethylaniline monooxygenase [N-oxide-forming] [Elysia marginata]